MSRFDAKTVNETWELEVLESGIKLRKGKDGERDVQVYESALCDDNGIFPIRGRYLLNWSLTDVPESKKLSEVILSPMWVTKKQYRRLLREAGKQWQRGGLEHLIQLIAKLFDKLGDKVEEMAEETILATITEMAVDKIDSEILTNENIKAILSMMLY